MLKWEAKFLSDASSPLFFIKLFLYNHCCYHFTEIIPLIGELLSFFYFILITKLETELY